MKSKIVNNNTQIVNPLPKEFIAVGNPDFRFNVPNTTVVTTNSNSNLQ